MAELGEVLSQLGEVEDLTPETFSEALHKSQPDLYQTIYNAGFSTSNGKWSEKQTELENQLKSLGTQVSERDNKIKELSEATPDYAKIEKKYKDSVSQLQAQLEESKNKYEEKINDLLGGRKSDKRSTYKTNIVNHLVSLGADKDYAEVLVSKSDFDKRIRQDDTGDIIEMGQRENPDLPMVLPSGAELAQSVAADIFKTIPSKFIDDVRPRGAGIGEFGSSNGVLHVSDTQKWSDAEYEKRMPEIQRAMREGRLVDDTA